MQRTEPIRIVLREVRKLGKRKRFGAVGVVAQEILRSSKERALSG